MSRLIVLIHFRSCACQFPSAAENVSEVLDHLLFNYRKELRPGFGGMSVPVVQNVFHQGNLSMHLNGT